MKLPMKREYERESTESGVEEVASKKAKTEEEAESDDEIMLDSVVKREEEVAKQEVWSDDELMSNYREEQKDRAREYQLLFLQLKGDRDRAAKISSEKDVLDLLSDAEMQEFWQMYWHKEWHILPNSGGLSDYQRLAIYHTDDDPYYGYAHYCFSYDFDYKYQQFTKELYETIQWGTTMSDACIIAEGIWKKYLKEVAIDRKLLLESLWLADYVSCERQEAKELISLFVELCKHEVDGEDFVPALKAIIRDNGLECYPLCKVSIEKALREKRGPWGRIRIKYDVMKKSIGIPRGEASLEDNSDLITRYFKDRPMSRRDSYIDYTEDKIRVAHKLEILQV